MTRRRSITVLVPLLLLIGCSSGGEATQLPSEFVGRAARVDEDALRVTWRVTCGVDEGDEVVTDVRDSTFEYETNPTDPAAGHVEEVDFEAWADRAASEDWVISTDGSDVTAVRSLSAPSDHDPCVASRS